METDYIVKLAVTIGAALLGILNTYISLTLRAIKNNQAELFAKINSMDARINLLQGEHNVNHRRR